MKIKRLFLSFLIPAFLIGVCLPGRAATHYVATNGSSASPFTTWATASTNIEWAVNAAENGDTVLISNGTYVLTNQVTVRSNITVSGVSSNNKPIVNGNNARRCFYFNAVTGVLENIYITRGYLVDDFGGGVYGLSSIITIRDCIFSNNVANSNATVYVYGGGLAVNLSTTLVQRCAFLENKGVRGGAIAIVSAGCATLVDRCTFYTNTAADLGGGLYDSSVNTMITGCDFICNVSSNYGGGVSLAGTMTHSTLASNAALGSAILGGGGAFSSGLITNCYFSNNIAGAYGGGASLSGGTAKNCLFARNQCVHAPGNYGAGGVYLASGSRMQDCIIEENTSTAYGGGVFLGQSFSGGILQCLIRNNYCAAGGGGIWSFFGPGSATIASCTIVSNSAAGNGGGLYVSDISHGFPMLENSIIYYNTGAAGRSNFYADSFTETTFTNCCLAPALAAGYTNVNVITSNPQFIDWQGGNYRLGRDSPCINTGTNRDWMTNSFDLDGLPRILQLTNDIGAYESAYDIFSVTPSAFTNTVMRTGATNFIAYLTNSSDRINIGWQAPVTSGWVTLDAGSGTLVSNAPLYITNSALTLAPGTHFNRLNIQPTNTALLYYPQTGAVDMTLQVAEFVRSAATLMVTVKQSGATSTAVQVWNSGSGILPYTVATNVAWLVVAPVSGSLTGQTADATNTLAVVVTNTQMPVGTYYGAITLQSGIDSSTLEINVELTVRTGPEMWVNPLILTGSVMMGQSPGSQTLRVANKSTIEVLGYGVASDSAWVLVSPTNGSLAPLATNTLAVTYSTATLTTNAAGPSNYHATITVTATNTDALGSPAAVAVNLVVNPKARLALGASQLSGTVAEGHDASNLTFEVWNGSGYYTLGYTLSDNQDWLMVTPSSGTSTGEHNILTVQFSTAGFTAGGTSNAIITVVGNSFDGEHTANAVDATQQVAVALLITPAAALATDALATYEFSARLGRAAGSRTFNVWNASAGGGVLRYTVSTNVAWLTVSPGEGTSGGEEKLVTLTCNAGGLVPGRHSGAVTITGIDQATGMEAYNSPAYISVELTIYGEKGFNFGGDGEGASDLVVYQQSTGLWDIKNLISGYTTNATFGGLGYFPTPGDFNGDGMTDLSVYRHSSGHWYIRPLTSQQLTVMGGSYWAGPELAELGGYVAVAGDYDGDGLTDPAMYNESSGVWSALFSSLGHAYVSGGFGGPGWAAVPADFDADGLTDPAVYHEALALWYVLYSSDSYRINSGEFGGPGFTAAPADYDGDGKADGAVYKEATGLWIVLPSSTLTAQGYSAVSGVFGGPGFIPVPADYTGDGKAETALYDEATGNWYIVAISGARVAWPVKLGGYGFIPVKP